MSVPIFSKVKHYYVDEAGDPNLFKRREESIVGKDGCSSYFILGLADIGNPVAVSEGLEALRSELLADPYFSNVPSFQVERGKTAVAFHAKDDVQEVRREVFKFLQQQSIRFYAVVRNKHVILRKVKEHVLSRPDYEYHPNQLYDRCVSRLFKDRLHQADGYKIHFARRGSSDRTAALENALSQARNNFIRQHGVENSAPAQILSGSPITTVNLQVVDYYLWALRRVYEKGEDRFLRSICEQVGLIHDVDDRRNETYGEFYTRARPLTVAQLSRGS